jgi:hypothetical protein
MILFSIKHQVTNDYPQYHHGKSKSIKESGTEFDSKINYSTALM